MGRPGHDDLEGARIGRCHRHRLRRPSGLAHTILRRGLVRIPTIGKICAGIQVLTREAAQHPKARAIYGKGGDKGMAFDAIVRTRAQAPDGGALRWKAHMGRQPSECFVVASGCHPHVPMFEEAQEPPRG